MKKSVLYLVIAAAIMSAVSCSNNGFKKTSSGLLYKIVSDGKGVTAKKGDIIKISYTQKLRDSVIFSSIGLMPAYVPVDSAKPTYSPTEVFSLLRKGDSAVIVQLADSIRRKSGQALPPFIKKKDKISLFLRVLDVFPNEELARADEDKERVRMHGIEAKQVEDYLSANHINATKTPRGAYVVVNDAGQGTTADSGKLVSVRYTGKSIPSGKVFESNMTDTSSPAFKFVVGRHQAIAGWDDALPYFKKGGKGSIYVPAFLAYDAQPGPENKPYANLAFDIEVADVTDAPAEKAPQMPQFNLPQQQPTPKKAK